VVDVAKPAVPEPTVVEPADAAYAESKSDGNDAEKTNADKADERGDDDVYFADDENDGDDERGVILD
jgi:hypothetical protein